MYNSWGQVTAVPFYKNRVIKTLRFYRESLLTILKCFTSKSIIVFCGDPEDILSQL